LSVFETHKDLKPGAVGPITNQCGTHQTGFDKAKDIRRIQECNTLSGFCLVFPKSVWEDVGGFDEEYELYGEDSDFCERLKAKGYTLFTCYDTFVFHHGHKSMEASTKDIQAIRQRSAQRFRKLWRK
jgi:GT2 family glycosyltransferase